MCVCVCVYREREREREREGWGGQTSDEDMRSAVLAIIDKEVSVRTIRCCVLARVCMRRPLRHPSLFSLSLYLSLREANKPLSLSSNRTKY